MTSGGVVILITFVIVIIIIVKKRKIDNPPARENIPMPNRPNAEYYHTYDQVEDPYYDAEYYYTPGNEGK